MGFGLAHQPGLFRRPVCSWLTGLLRPWVWLRAQVGRRWRTHFLGVEPRNGGPRGQLSLPAPSNRLFGGHNWIFAHLLSPGNTWRYRETSLSPMRRLGFDSAATFWEDVFVRKPMGFKRNIQTESLVGMHPQKGFSLVFRGVSLGRHSLSSLSNQVKWLFRSVDFRILPPKSSN